MKKRLVLVIAVVMVLAFAAGTVAAPAVTDITAKLAADFKFTLNGNDWQAKDADGSVMAPIVYKDRTYLPVRAISEALGVKVDWDADTRTVILGEAPVKEEPVKEEPVKEEPVKEEPVKEEPVKEEPVKEEPVKEEPAPAAELAISPTGADLSKANVADADVKITWGPATKITGITGSALGGAVKITLNEGKEYTVAGDVLTLKADAVAALLPVPISMVPDGTVMTLTIKFDQGEKTFDITVVS